MQVSLDKHEIEVASIVAVLRYGAAKRGGYARPFALKPNQFGPFEHEVNSTCAEAACARGLNRYWSMGVNTFRRVPDVGHYLEVRYTEKPTGRLIVREHDSDQRAYFLVRGVVPTFDIVGWMWGWQAKQPQWIANPDGDGSCFMIPDRDLYAVEQRDWDVEEDWAHDPSNERAG